MPEHAANRGNAVDHEQGKVAFQVSGSGGWHVSMHLRKTRHKKAIGAVDDPGALRHWHLVDVAHVADYAVPDDDGLLLDDPFVRHRDHVDVEERSDIGSRRAGRDQGEEQEKVPMHAGSYRICFRVSRLTLPPQIRTTTVRPASASFCFSIAASATPAAPSIS